MTDNSSIKSLLFTQCLQNDFISEEQLGKNDIHIGEAESKRLRGNLDTFLKTFKNPERGVHFVHIRDWHDPTSKDVREQFEMKMFKNHCIKDTFGSKLYGTLEDFAHRYIATNTIVDSNALNDVHGTTLENVIKSVVGEENADNIAVGVIGVWSNAKVLFLVYELVTRFNFTKIAVCPSLCAANTVDNHARGLDIMKNVLGVDIIENIEDFQKFLGIHEASHNFIP
jgi:nicotinamidase-related amidase